jgi:hypothetical protein
MGGGAPSILNTGLLLAVLDPVGSEASSIGGERCYTAAADHRIRGDVQSLSD